LTDDDALMLGQRKKKTRLEEEKETMNISDNTGLPAAQERQVLGYFRKCM
jgi:hypothetical protein